MSTRASADRSAGASESGTRIELCGALRADLRGRQVTPLLPGRQGRLLFAFLVVNRHRRVSRHELHDVLWPVELPDAPESGLSSVLARVRRAVGEGVIEGRAELALRLEPDAHIDVERAASDAREAERALADGDPRAAMAAAEVALETVTRPLLPGLEGAWIDDAQAELTALEPNLLEILARAALALGGESLTKAERFASALVDRHPFREAGHALLIEVQARRGNLAEATRTYHRLRVFLRDELGTAPSASVSALHERLLQRGRAESLGDLTPPAAGGRVPLPPIGGARPAAPFVGRREPLDRVRALWREVTTGRHRLALVVGEPGVGKTRLAAHFASEVHETGGAVLYGRCDEEPLVSYQPFVEALRHYLRHGDWEEDAKVQGELLELSRLIPEAEMERSEAPPPRDPETGRYLLFEAVATLLRRGARVHPLLLVLDDLQWADRGTLLLLRHLLRHPRSMQVMVLGLFRDVELGIEHPLAGLVADLRRELPLERVALEGFDEDESDALVTAHLAAPATEAFVRGLRTQTEGNPFFMQEALRSLVESEAVAKGEAASEQALQSVGVPESVADVILRRLGRVSELAGELLTVAAVIGREFDAGVAAAVLATPVDGALEAMDEAMAAGLVGEVADSVDRFAFCHALVRAAAYDRLSTSRRLRLHLRVAEALEAGAGVERAGAGELAHHFFLARQVGGAEKAVRYALRAAEEDSRALAHEEAAAHYRRALEVLGGESGDGSLRCDVLLALGRSQWRAGDSAARETYFEAADTARRRGAPEQLARAALGLGERYWEAKAVDEQYRHLLGEALSTLGDEDSVVRARLMARMAENLHFTAEQQRGAELSLEAVAMARRLGEVDTLVTALMGRHVALLHIEHLDERLRLIDEVLTLTREHRALSAEACHWRLFDLCELGEVDQARHDHAELAALAQQLRQPLLQHLAIGWEVVFAHLAGDVGEAERLAMQSFDFARRAQVGDASSSLAAMLFALRRQQGRLGELVTAMEALVDEAPSAPLAWNAALALANLDAGNVEEGRRRYERFAARDFAAVPRDWYWLATIGLLAEACVALEDLERAPHLYELLLPYADRSLQVIFAVCFGSVHRQLGILARVMERFDDAEEHFRAALEVNERMGALLMTAETRCEYGEMLLRRGNEGDRDRAAVLGALAEEIAAPRGLDGLAQRARALTGSR
ncbi:MAG: AAA family ATPase [Actinobacteria bacterium]|nr:AAA family ATPase [Actinomycetota bacterium]